MQKLLTLAIVIGCAKPTATTTIASTPIPVPIAPVIVPTSGAAQIAVAIQHNCARMVDGTVRCWGDGTSGEVNGDHAEHHTPVEVPGVAHAIDVAVGMVQSCARLASGEVWCWGSHGLRPKVEKRLDDMADVPDVGDDDRTPGPIPSLAHATKLWLGSQFDGCASFPRGPTKCWGSGSAREAVSKTDEYDSSPAPVVPALADAVDFSLGESLGCAVMKDTTVRCWGVNDSGQVGDGTTRMRLVPVPVRGLRGVVQVVVGDRSACARLADTTVTCWGSNDMHQLGDGTTIDHHEPSPVPRLAGVRELSSATIYTCARLDSGKLVCWGGDDAASAVTEIAGAEHMIAVAAGHTHHCALRDDGNVLCWGGGERGVIGDGLQARRETPTRVKWSLDPIVSAGLPADRHVAEIAVGIWYSCARLDDGSVRCWGDNQHGEVDTLGVDQAITRPKIVPGLARVAQLALEQVPMARLTDGTGVLWGVGAGAPQPLRTRNMVELVEGSTYTCARQTSGRLDCHNVSGSDLSTMNALAVATSHASVCALLKGGIVACGGFNGQDQIGVDGVESRDSFVPVLGIGNAVQVVTGTEHACVRLADGTVRCWGNGNSIGDGSRGPTARPVTPTGLGAVEALWAGGAAACARRPDGDVLCWGQYGLPEGNRETWYSETPVVIPWLHGARSVALGMFHSCALLADGVVGCWGQNDHGQIGDGTMDNRAVLSRVQW